ncbi:MAG: hypothetical protein GAK43_02592 [Stenotrophomonas maltophilia]|nr:MAG: hypothetical protein GAK43_02592 [Stenotrophomonas maltophilia]
MHPNALLIQRFYQAFAARDGQAMAACYARDVVFHDPAFGELHGAEAGAMWRMLTLRAQDLELSVHDIQADAQQGSARWIARYTFSQTGRQVENHIQARFVFADGLILRHDDHFDLWRWARQALGAKGWLLGWTPLVQRAIRAQARRGLAAFQRQA